MSVFAVKLGVFVKNNPNVLETFNWRQHWFIHSLTLTIAFVSLAVTSILDCPMLIKGPSFPPLNSWGGKDGEHILSRIVFATLLIGFFVQILNIWIMWEWLCLNQPFPKYEGLRPHIIQKISQVQRLKLGKFNFWSVAFECHPIRDKHVTTCDAFYVRTGRPGN